MYENEPARVVWQWRREGYDGSLALLGCLRPPGPQSLGVLDVTLLYRDGFKAHRIARWERGQKPGATPRAYRRGFISRPWPGFIAVGLFWGDYALAIDISTGRGETRPLEA